MAAVLLDTHALVWSLLDFVRVPSETRSVVDAADRKLVSAASLYEISYKVRIGKWQAAARIVPVLLPTLLDSGFEVAEITWQIASAAGDLDWQHRDPFDRMIAATAIVLGADLVTANRAFRSPGAPPLTLVW